MAQSALAGFLLVLLLVPPASTPSPAASALVDLTNAERKRAGLAALRANDRLMEAAELQARQLLDEGRLQHDFPDARYPRLLDRLAAVRYKWRAAGENLAFGQGDAGQAMAGWMKSKGHRANILNGGFTEIGVARVAGRNGRPYWVQVFARPAGLRVLRRRVFRLFVAATIPWRPSPARCARHPPLHAAQ